MTLGDVFATVNGIFAAGVSLWAALVLTGLLFEARTTAAAEKLESSPARCIGTGLLLAATAGLIAFLLVAQQNGLLKLIGWIALILLLCLATLGGAGLTHVVANRILRADVGLPRYRAMGRAAGLLVAATLIPFLGWTIGIVSILANLGAATLTLRRPRPSESAAPTASPAPAVATAYDIQ